MHDCLDTNTDIQIICNIHTKITKSNVQKSFFLYREIIVNINNNSFIFRS